VFHRAAPYGLIGFIFLSWSIAIALSSAVWAWIYPANFGVQAGILLTAGVALAGYPIAWWRRAFVFVPKRADRSLIGLLLALCVVLVALVPAYSSWTHLSMGDRLGPDGAGYAISARTLSEDTTRSTLESQLLAQVGGGSIKAILTPPSKLVDTPPSETTQVAAEFLLGANRWGYSGVVGSVLYLFGQGQLWGVLTLLAAFGLLTACIGVWAIVNGSARNLWPGLVAIVLMGLNCVLLQAWHEGALAQVWVLPACVLFARPLVVLGEGDRLAGAISIALGCALMLVAFNDGMLIYPLVFGLCMVFSIPLLGRRWWTTWWPLFAGAAVGGVMVTPATSEFVTTLSRSVNENGSAGWPQPRWLDLAEAFGLHNVFRTTTTALGTRSTGENAIQVGEEVVVLGLLVALIWRRLREPAVVLLTSVLVAGIGVYVKTRYFDHVSNYQYFKTVAWLVPAGALALGVLIARSTAQPEQKPTARRARHVPRWTNWSLRRIVVFGLSGIVAATVIVAATSYVSTYRTHGITVPSSFERLGTSPDAQTSFDRFNVISSTAADPHGISGAGLLTIDLGAEVNLNWIGRYVGSPSTHFGDRTSNPVGLLVFEEDCPGFSCLARIPDSQVPFRGDGVAIVELDRDSRALASLPEIAWFGWAATRFYALGGSNNFKIVPKGWPKD
jgi:hypothetical protein